MYTNSQKGMFSKLRKAARSAASVLAIGLTTLSVTTAKAADYPEMNLKFGHPYNEAHPLALGAQRFADLVSERSGGNVTVTVFPNSTIGSSKELVEAMRINVVDIALVPTTNVASFYSKLDVFYLPSSSAIVSTLMRYRMARSDKVSSKTCASKLAFAHLPCTKADSGRSRRVTKRSKRLKTWKA